MSMEKRGVVSTDAEKTAAKKAEEAIKPASPVKPPVPPKKKPEVE